MPAVDEPLLTLDDDAHSQYALREPREIVQVLHALVEARAMISAALVPGGHSCPTALLAVHDDGSLILDGNRHEATNRRMAAANRLVCSTQMDLVPIRFRLHAHTRITHEGYPAFVAPWPDTLLRLQRREMYRLQVSPAAPVTLQIDAQGAAPDSTLGGLRVLDISGGGIAVSVPDGEERRFSTHSRLSPCLLRLAEGDPLPLTLEVTHFARYEVRGVPHWRAGCRFVDLPTAYEQRILQYIFQVERQRNARQRLGS